MSDLIRRALDKAGYYDKEATESNLIQCFKDYVDAAVFRDLDLDEVDVMIEDGELTVRQMAVGLLKMR